MRCTNKRTPRARPFIVGLFKGSTVRSWVNDKDLEYLLGLVNKDLEYLERRRQKSAARLGLLGHGDADLVKRVKRRILADKLAALLRKEPMNGR